VKKPPMRLRGLLRLAAVSLLLLVVGPAGAQSAGELRVALPWTPENLDPTMNLSSIRAKVGVGIFDSLVGRDAENASPRSSPSRGRRSTT